MVANTYRIIIETSDLSKNNWNLIYRFIEKCYGRGSFGKEDFDSLKEQAKIVIDTNPKDEDVYSCDGLDEIQFENLTENQNNWMFNIIYKAGDREDFGDLVPFFLLKKKYRENITFGIDVENVIKQNNYTFKCSIFLFFIKDKKPKIGNHSIYFIHEFNTKTGEIINVSALKYTQKENDYSKASPNFIPLLPINEENFKLFQHANDVEIPLCKYISKSIKKSKLDKNINFSSKFEEWFIKAYCSNCNITTDFEQFKPSLHDYYINIYELVQNIIFHAQGRGLLYIIFNKKEDMIKDGKTLYPYCNIPDIDTYENTQRFLEIGIYDYNEKGIIDTFKENCQLDENINLKTFVDPTKILPTNNDNLSIRYAAHLGIKSFVSSVLHHKGYFHLESNYLGNKTGIECCNGKIEEEYKVDNISGTHYKIVLPVNKNKDVKDFKPIFGHSVSDSLKELLKQPYNIKEIQFEESWMSDIKNISDKNSQTIAIQSIGNKIIDKFKYESTIGALSIDMGKVDINTNILFKILAYVQLNNKNSIKSLVLNNLKDSIIDAICETIKNLGFAQESKGQPIWSRDHALILMSNKSLRTQIICGEEYPEICRVNQKINQFYYNEKNVFDIYESEQDETCDIDQFVLPYECVIGNESGNRFLQYVEQILDNPLGNIEFGCLIDSKYTDSKYTRIGSKLYLENYYEADHLFKYSFFVDRLAYFIVKVIKSHLDNKIKNLILIGHLPYSELLVKKVKEYLESLSNKIVYTSIAKENEHTNSLDFKISDELKKKIKETDNQNLYITIVPIASSLSTNDKVISIFKQKNEITSDNFLNFCSIVVRDQDESKVSDNEKAFKWKEIKTEDNIIYTNYAHAKEIHYTVSKSGIWHPLIDKTTFPKQYGEEKYINQTQNSSLNTKDRFGYLIAALPSIEEIKDELKISVDKEIEDEELYIKYY